MHSKSVSYYSNELHDAFTGKMKVTQLCLTLCHPMDYTVHGILQARILEWVAFPFSRGSSQSRIESRSPTLQADSLPAEPPGKPKNTGVGSLSLLRCIFLTQESNQGLLHCRRILYQLSYEAILCLGDEPDHPYISHLLLSLVQLSLNPIQKVKC